jgi:hypothetical protein
VDSRGPAASGSTGVVGEVSCGSSAPDGRLALYGFVQHLYTVPGAYTPVLSVANDCGAFAVVVTVYATP